MFDLPKIIILLKDSIELGNSVLSHHFREDMEQGSTGSALSDATVRTCGSYTSVCK